MLMDGRNGGGGAGRRETGVRCPQARPESLSGQACPAAALCTEDSPPGRPCALLTVGTAGWGPHSLRQTPESAERLHAGRVAGGAPAFFSFATLCVHFTLVW